MRLYPIQLNLHRKPVLVVGAGSVGLRKAQRLLEAASRSEVGKVERLGFMELFDNDKHALFARGGLFEANFLDNRLRKHTRRADKSNRYR